MKQYSKRPTKKIALFTSLAVVAVLVAGGLLLWHKHTIDSKPVAMVTAVGPNFVNYSPPTGQEKKDTEAHKDDLSKQMADDGQNNGDPGGQDGAKQVKPVITNISTINGQITVTSYVSGIFEDGGICTLTAAKGSQQKTFTANAFANATTTDCQPFRLASSEFPGGGTWTFRVAYTSSTASGSSDTKDFKVD